MYMFLNCTAMSGQADHHHLRNAPFLGTAVTAPGYRFYSVRDEFPGLVPVTEDGASIAGELYDLDDEVWRISLGPAEPSELVLGTIALLDGRLVSAMLLDLDRVPAEDLHDITEVGGWRAHLSRLGFPTTQARTS